MLKPKNWNNFQHYKDRCPPWIKLHRDLLNNKDYMRLPVASKALAPMFWLLASESKLQDGSFDASDDELEFRLRVSVKEIQLGRKSLIDNGFFVVASGVLADCLQVAIPEERRGETEKEKEKEKRIVARGSRMPDNFEPDFDFAYQNGIQSPSAEFERFSDYWKSQPGQKGVKTDWHATWRNWCRNAKQSFGKQHRSRSDEVKDVVAALTGKNVIDMGVGYVSAIESR